MKKLYTLFVMAIFAHTTWGQVLYFEDFNNMSAPVPTSVTNTTTGGPMTTWNVDGLTPAPSVNYVTDAWIAREDFINDASDSVAFSTSWYSPAGTANDWMVTPQIAIPAAGASLSWDAVAPDANYPDGYEVWISTVSDSVADLLAGTLAFSTNAESSTWTSHSYDLVAFSNQSIYIGFRNNSSDMFLLMVDDIQVLEGALPDDVGITAEGDEFTALTLNPVRGCPIELGARVTNNGNSATNVFAHCNIYKDTVYMTTLYSDTLGGLAMGADSALVFPDTFPMVSTDQFIFEYVVSMDEIDTITNNDTAYSALFLNNTFMARDNGSVTGTLGIGSGISGILGQNFTLKNPDRLVGANAFLGSIGSTSSTTVLSDSTSFIVYSTNMDGSPDSVLAQTDYYMLSLADTNGVLTLSFDPPLDLPAGTFFLGITEADSNITIGTTPFIFTPGTTWVIFGANPWRNNEFYGINVTYVLRPLFEPCPPSLSLASTIPGSEFDIKYEVDSFITSVDEIESGALNILYDAGNHIDLLEGFSVGLGAEFEAVIDGCGGLRYVKKDRMNMGQIVKKSRSASIQDQFRNSWIKAKKSPKE